jgi:hypothetical protein
MLHGKIWVGMLFMARRIDETSFGVSQEHTGEEGDAFG